MSYIGNPPAEAYTNTVKDTFSGDGSTVAFTLSLPTTTNNVRVVVENVIQDPTVAYGVSGTTLTFTSAPPSGTNNIYVVHLGPAVQTVQPPSDLSGNFTLTGDLTQTGDYTQTGDFTLTGTAEATNLTRGGSQVYSRDNILGTVSESSGVPTGAIIERGSNANGEYVKYADGTMTAFVHTPSISNGGTLRTKDVVRSWPVSFNATPIAVATQSVGHGDMDAGAAGMMCNADNALTSSQYKIGYRNNLASTYTLSADVIAFGRWF